MNAPLRTLALAFTLACAGCNARPLTQLVVVTESSLRVPSELDKKKTDFTAPSVSMRHRMLAIRSISDLPATLGVVHRSGPLGPIHIRVRGRLRSSVVVTREAEVMLEAGRTRRLDLSLDAACRDVTCREAQSCARGTCRSLTIAPGELRDFNGVFPFEPDASSPDAGSPDTPTPLTCTPACTDPSHATGQCVLGTCRLTCESNRSDCNGLYSDGCEIDTRSSSSHCGGCGRPCDARERCRSSECN